MLLEDAADMYSAAVLIAAMGMLLEDAVWKAAVGILLVDIVHAVDV